MSLKTVQELYSSVGESLLGHRCVGEVYLREEDFANSIEVAESGLKLYRQETVGRGIELPA